MDLGSIFLILALFVIVGMFVGRPLFETKQLVKQPAGSPADHARSMLLAERDRVLNALEELDFDFALGKIPEVDYPEQRNGLLQRGVEILRQLDELQDGSGDAVEDLDHRIEAAILARQTARQLADTSARAEARRNSYADSVVPVDDDIELMLAKRRRDRKEKAAGFCPKCGGPLQQTDQFCPKCGAQTA